MDTIPFPDRQSEALTEKACDELAEWVARYIDKGIDAVTLIGMLELYKTAVSYNMLEDVE
jgi:hypothetical protein